MKALYILLMIVPEREQFLHFGHISHYPIPVLEMEYEQSVEIYVLYNVDDWRCSYSQTLSIPIFHFPDHHNQCIMNK